MKQLESVVGQEVTQGWVCNFDQGAALSVQQIGGKGYNLIRLRQFGFTVPEGFCISTDAYQYFIKETGLGQDIYQLLQLGDETVYSEIAELICKTAMPTPLAEAILTAYRQLGAALVAVRSSGVDEDAAEYSFAGQHDTFLNIAEAQRVLDSVRACWASMWNASAMAYRARQAAPGMPQAIGVVVQAMINGEASGVAFSENPLQGQADQLLIEACVGLGEGLVSGRVVSDSYVLGKSPLQLASSQINYKPTALQRGEDGSTVERELDAALAVRPALSEAQALELGRLVVLVERSYGKPQDIEWTCRAGQFFLLQSRPITTTAVTLDSGSPHVGEPDEAIAKRILWSRMDIGEIFTGRLTPLGVSFAKYYQYRVHRDCGVGLGLLDLGKEDEYMGYYKGHVYLNVAYTAYLLAQTPAGKDQSVFIKRFASAEVDVERYQNPYGAVHQHDRYTPGRTNRYWLRKTAQELLGAKARAKHMVASRYQEFDRAMAMDLGRLSLFELREEMTHCLDYFKAMHVGYMPFYINAFGLYGVLEELCHAWLPQDGKHLQNRLKGDMSNLRTVESARDIWRLCKALDAYPEVKALFLQADVAAIEAALPTSSQGREFLKREMTPFMRANGVRGREEMELTYPRWIDDPGYVLQMIKTYLEQGYEVENKLQASSQVRSVDTDKLLDSLPWFKRAVMKRVIRMYSACSRMREETRMSMITSIWLLRRIVYELGRRLTERGLLKHIDEVAYLDFGDLLTHVNDYEAAETLFSRAKIEQARRQHSSYLEQPEPPLTFIGSAHNAVPVKLPEAGEHLQGLGTSNGRISGRARVITDLRREAGLLQKGEIIVARFTDASWTPLFALAKGVVTDIGSMLSHSSIVAREFGIPSVVNTKLATELIKTGDWITLDGDSGVVIIENDKEENTPC
ncbi:PEP/pyruvate-binding domain-containing protein [Chitinimonas sp. JJ19]|uniref:PEP/pyruvate-binding domain-containing protein n=1 Tax=Chitinimonas sp. JJ19 TaxID=3109352 RepID=UPI003001A11B